MIDDPFAVSTVRPMLLPSRIVSGEGAVEHLADLLPEHVAVITGSQSFVAVHNRLAPMLESRNHRVLDYGIDCCELELERLEEEVGEAQIILGVGGGKALDSAKLVAHRLSLPVMTLPTSAATCAAMTALANVYSPEGRWLYGVALDRAPEAVLVDYGLLSMAPPRLLASGIADAIAKWFESSASVNSGESDVMALMAVETARFIHQRLRMVGPLAIQEARDARPGQALVQALDACVTMAGTVGALGGARCRSVAAHAVCNGLTSLPGTRRSWHGEKVGFGILVQQLLLDEPDQARDLVGFYRSLGLPVTMAELGYADDESSIRGAAEAACSAGSSIHLIPGLNPVRVAEAMHAVNVMGAERRRRHSLARS